MSNKEEWRPIRGHDGYYVSNMGRIKRDSITIEFESYNQYGTHICRKKLPEKIYSRRRRKGRNSIVIDGREYYVYRLVAANFLRPLKNGEEINHIDGNKENDRLDNLEIVSRIENQNHAFDSGLNNFIGKALKIKLNGKIYSSLGEAERLTGIKKTILSRAIKESKNYYSGRKYSFTIERV